MASKAKPLNEGAAVARTAAAARRWGLPGAPYLLSATLVAATFAAWGLYLLAGQRHLVLLGYGLAVAALIAVSLTAEELRIPAAADVARSLGRLARPRPLALVAVVTAGLGLGLRYRLGSWQAPLMLGGDSGDYDLQGRMTATAHQFFLVPWRTPGYGFVLAAGYTLAGIGNTVVLHAWQILLSLLVAVLMSAIAYRVTGSRALALLALAAGAFAYPIVAPAAYLMTEMQAMFLLTLAVFLTVAARSPRTAGAAALALGPVLALTYETRPSLMPALAWLGVVALVAPSARWRQRAVLVAGAVLVLAPVAAINLYSPYRTLTAGPAVDLLPQIIGQDRFDLYYSAPNSPALLEQFQAAIVTDGAATEYWRAQPPAELAKFTSARMRLMERYLLDHPWPFIQLSLRRGPLLFRYDQENAYTRSERFGDLGMLGIDVLLALSVVAVATWWRRGRRLPLALIGGTLLLYTAPLALFHVEQRYSQPILPILVVLGLMGLWSLVQLTRAAVAPFRPRRFAIVAGAVAAVVLSVPIAETSFWPALADDYAPKPATGRYEVASCYVGHHLLTSVAWRPGTSEIIAAGANGMTRWDMTSHSCPWNTLLLENIWDLGFSRDGTRLAVGAYQGGILDAESLQPYPPPAHASFLSGLGTEILSVSLDPTGDRLAFAATGFHFVGIYDVPSRGVPDTAQLPDSPVAIRWSPDGSMVAVAVADRTVRLFDQHLQPLGTLSLPAMPTALAWSPSSRTLAAGDQAGELRLLNVSTPSRPVVMVSADGHRGAVRALAFAPDGQRLASGGSDHLARIWRAGDLDPERTLAGHTASVWSLAWSTTSMEIVTAAADGNIAVWSAR